MSIWKHQKIIAKFLSSYTPYNGLLVFHEMGTGKTCATIAATELIREQGRYKGVLYLAPGGALVDNFRNELIFKCTDGRYIPENYDELTTNKKTIAIKKTTKFYKLFTYDTFTKFIKNENYEKYDNFVIVLDEVHNISSTTNNYGYIKKILT